jgi:hypothetical protein
VKINGKEIKLRGSNKLYHQLDDLDKLFEMLKEKSIGALSKELGIPQNCIRYRVFSYFPEEWIAQVKKDRRYHKNKTY